MHCIEVDTACFTLKAVQKAFAGSELHLHQSMACSSKRSCRVRQLSFRVHLNQVDGVLLNKVMQSASAELQSAPQSGGWRAPPERRTAAGTETTEARSAPAVPALFEAGIRLACGAAALGPPTNRFQFNLLSQCNILVKLGILRGCCGGTLSVGTTYLNCTLMIHQIYEGVRQPIRL